jgi:hypothetical protein
MAVTQYNVTNSGPVAVDIGGVDIEPGQTRDLVADGVTLEEIARSQAFTAGLIAGTLQGPPQAELLTASAPILPGTPYAIASTAPAGVVAVLPPARAAVQVPIPITIANYSPHTQIVAPDAGDLWLGDFTGSLAPGDSVALWCALDGANWGWINT